jgi:hypothetical protein
MNEFDNNEYILKLVKEAFATLSKNANIHVDIELVQGKRQFRIVFSNNDRLGVVVHVDIDFSARLGFE